MALQNQYSLSRPGKAQSDAARFTGPAQFTRKDIVYCPMCTHTVEGDVVLKGKRMVVAEGQRCLHCHSSLDAGYVMRTERAA